MSLAIIRRELFIEVLTEPIIPSYDEVVDSFGFRYYLSA